MSNRKCVELTAVFNDGTVERWEGVKAGCVWSACDWSWLDKTEKPTITHPLRKVTTGTSVVKRYVECDEGERDDVYFLASDGESIEFVEHLPPSIIPVKPDGRLNQDWLSMSGPWCWRVVVEVVPVEDTP
jgi:hypothetical protein